MVAPILIICWVYISLSKPQQLASNEGTSEIRKVYVSGYFVPKGRTDCVKETPLAVNDKLDSGYYDAVLPSGETEMLDIFMIFFFHATEWKILQLNKLALRPVCTI
jgi:hypothetical protein